MMTMSEYREVLETTDDGRYRVILVQDTDCESPTAEGDAWVTSVVTFDGRDRWNTGTTWRAMRDPGDRLPALEHFWSHDWSIADDLFKRWMRLFHGIEVFDVTIHNGYRDTSSAMAWVEPSEAKRVGWNDAPFARNYDAEKIVTSEVDEYNRWTDGDTWGYVVQKLTTWARVPDQDETGELPDDWQETAETRDEWEDTDESCWGFIGHEYAEQEAREALKAVAENA